MLLRQRIRFVEFRGDEGFVVVTLQKNVQEQLQSVIGYEVRIRHEEPIRIAESITYIPLPIYTQLPIQEAIA